jgi:hypothetical protein
VILEVTRLANSLFVIFPYHERGTWMFDDPAVGLAREPFVSGIPEMIDLLVDGIPEARQGFKLLFSAQPFPAFHVELDRVSEESGGAWYRWAVQQRQGWLCPALLKYFDAPPVKLYCRAEPLIQ